MPGGNDRLVIYVLNYMYDLLLPPGIKGLMTNVLIIKSICSAKQWTGFYYDGNIGCYWVNSETWSSAKTTFEKE